MMKSMKKLVLAGLILLTSVVVLAGCKMEPEGQQGSKVYEFTSEPRILTDYSSPNNTGSEWTYVAFGDWPQTIKANGVTVDETKSRQMGMFTAYLGSDGNYYVEAEERAYDSGSQYKYSDGTQVGQNGTSTQWFKVEPIIWRVLNKDYSESGRALLLAENILTGGIKWDDSENNYMESNIRKWLNGNSGSEKESDYSGNAGFLQTAFTPEAQELITPTTVDTSDKIFLLSGNEATTADHDIAYDTLRRFTTDYAKATGAFQGVLANYGGLWWLRSPNNRDSHQVRYIDVAGNNNSEMFVWVGEVMVGIVPALSISINGN